MNSGDESYHDIISTETLEDICDGSQTHPNVNRRKARYKICDRIRKRKSEREGALEAMRSTVKGSHKVFSTAVKEISQELTPLGKSGSEVSHFISEPRKFDEVKKLSEDIKKPLLKVTLKKTKNVINNHNFLIEYQN